MYQPEYRTSEEISRVAAHRYAVMTAVAERKAEAKRVRHRQRIVGKSRAAVTSAA